MLRLLLLLLFIQLRIPRFSGLTQNTCKYLEINYSNRNATVQFQAMENGCRSNSLNSNCTCLITLSKVKLVNLTMNNGSSCGCMPSEDALSIANSEYPFNSITGNSQNFTRVSQITLRLVRKSNCSVNYSVSLSIFNRRNPAQFSSINCSEFVQSTERQPSPIVAKSTQRLSTTSVSLKSTLKSTSTTSSETPELMSNGTDIPHASESKAAKNPPTNVIVGVVVGVGGGFILIVTVIVIVVVLFRHRSNAKSPSNLVRSSSPTENSYESTSVRSENGGVNYQPLDPPFQQGSNAPRDQMYSAADSGANTQSHDLNYDNFDGRRNEALATTHSVGNDRHVSEDNGLNDRPFNVNENEITVIDNALYE